MLFNSFTFLVFLVIVFSSYWGFRKQTKIQNLILLISSYVFYGWWDWRFLSLIALSSVVDYTISLNLGKVSNTTNRKLLLWSSILLNIGLLGFFKYFNFFIDSFEQLLGNFGIQQNINSLNIILPVGISFYTFQTLSYTIDVYNRKFEAVKDPVAFFAFVSFFPQLVAGPIERARNLVPQFTRQRNFDYSKAADGMRQMLWGFFKKMVIADNCASYVNDIFGNYQHHTGGVLLLGAILFGFQIYGDFSGYSDIAIGTARLFGFNLMQNFAFPYFSRDIAEFWRRWHISLSTWFRDYVYIPLGGSRGTRLNQFRNTLIIFLVSGLWHGANFTFIAWGAAHALLFLPLLFFNRNRKNIDPINNSELKNPMVFVRVISTFLLVSLAWVFFRADSIGDAFHYLGRLFATLFDENKKHILFHQSPTFYCLIFMLVMEWMFRKKQYGLSVENWKWPFRWLIYMIIVFAIFFFGNFSETEFIYFAF